MSRIAYDSCRTSYYQSIIPAFKSSTDFGGWKFEITFIKCGYIE